MSHTKKVYDALPDHQGDVHLGAGGASLGSSIVNLSAAVLGAGMLGLPYGFAEAGWATSFLLLGGSTLTSGFTMHLLSIVSREVAPEGDATFFKLAATVGDWGTAFVEWTVICNVFGLATSYLVVFGSTMPFVVGSRPNSGILTSTHLWVTIGLVCVAPMAFASTLDALRFTSAGGMACVAYVVGLVSFYWFFDPDALCDDDEPHCGGNEIEFVADVSLLNMLSVVTFSFTAHVQALTVANEVQEYTQAKMDTVIFGGIFLCLIVYGVVGFGGYWGFGSDIAGNLLISYPTHSVVVTAARVSMSFLVAISYPLMAKPGRDSFLSILRSGSSPELAERESTYNWFTLCFLGASYAIAMGVVDYPSALNVILSLVGATTSTIIAYVVPTLVYAKMFPEPHWKRTLAILVGIFGVVQMPFCIAAVFLS